MNTNTRRLVCVNLTLIDAAGNTLDVAEVPRGKRNRWSIRHWRKSLRRLPGVAHVSRQNVFENGRAK